MPKVFYDEEITKDELNTYKLSDEDLIEGITRIKNLINQG